MRRADQTALAILAAILAAAPFGSAAPLVFRCAANNDLYRAVAAGGGKYRRFDNTAEVIRAAPRGGAVAILADGYPDRMTQVDPALLDEAARKKLRLYIEYPASLPGVAVGRPREAEWERGVVASDAFAPSLNRWAILMLGRCRYVPMPAAKPDLVLARVAGFDTAVYGLPDRNVHPILFEHTAGSVLVATTRLSQFVTARYAPAAAWTEVWTHILRWLRPAEPAPKLIWSPTVVPSYGPDERLPADVEAAAFRRGAEWPGRAHLFPAPGDGSTGVIEGISSVIRYDGTQPFSSTVRADCIGEASMVQAFAGRRDTATKLNDFLYTRSALALGTRADPKSPSFGLLGWSLPDAPGVYYGDDNARAILGTMTSAVLLNDSRWDDRLLEALLANLRTTGRFGFRGNRIEEADLQRAGWRRYYEKDTVSYAPHYEAYLWACFLRAYEKTHFKPFLERARTAIRMTMAAYPGDWHWTNGIQQERARMLLPLAWLVRVEDTPEHRGWLRRIVTDMLASQNEAGAIREELGPEGHGSYWPPRSNDEYGAREAPLLQRNGDPVSDLLYTSEFALLGLHEAAAATGELGYRSAEDRLARFLCRIQTRSTAHPELDGAWYRAFDLRRWEYWGSNADMGWGAWSAESGWPQAWIPAVLEMRQRRLSLWDLTSGSGIGFHASRIIPLMLPGSE